MLLGIYATFDVWAPPTQCAASDLPDPNDTANDSNGGRAKQHAGLGFTGNAKAGHGKPLAIENIQPI